MSPLINSCLDVLKANLSEKRADIKSKDMSRQNIYIINEWKGETRNEINQKSFSYIQYK
jgi:hypothetical protein